MDFVNANIGTGRPVGRYATEKYYRAVPARTPRPTHYGDGRLELKSFLYEGRHRRNDGEVSMPELNFAGIQPLPGEMRRVPPTLGQGNIITQAQEVLASAKPAVDFVGRHPWLSLTLLVGAIIAGGAAGGYIGAGVRSR